MIPLYFDYRMMIARLNGWSQSHNDNQNHELSCKCNLELKLTWKCRGLLAKQDVAVNQSFDRKDGGVVFAVFHGKSWAFNSQIRDPFS